MSSTLDKVRIAARTMESLRKTTAPGAATILSPETAKAIREALIEAEELISGNISKHQSMSDYRSRYDEDHNTYASRDYSGFSDNLNADPEWSCFSDNL